MKLPPPNRIAVYCTALAGLLTAVAPAVANLDSTSTAGVLVGFLGIVGVAVKWLEGWQRHEQNQLMWADSGTVVDDDGPGDADVLPHIAVETPSEPDQGDVGHGAEVQS